MSVNLKLSPAAKVIAGREAENFLNDVNGVTAVVIATVDGFDVASAMRAAHATSGRWGELVAFGGGGVHGKALT